MCMCEGRPMPNPATVPNPVTTVGHESMHPPTRGVAVHKIDTCDFYDRFLSKNEWKTVDKTLMWTVDKTQKH